MTGMCDAGSDWVWMPELVVMRVDGLLGLFAWVEGFGFLML